MLDITLDLPHVRTVARIQRVYAALGIIIPLIPPDEQAVCIPFVDYYRTVRLYDSVFFYEIVGVHILLPIEEIREHGCAVVPLRELDDLSDGVLSLELLYRREKLLRSGSARSRYNTVHSDSIILMHYTVERETLVLICSAILCFFKLDVLDTLSEVLAVRVVFSVKNNVFAGYFADEVCIFPELALTLDVRQNAVGIYVAPGNVFAF